jgi:hypothetical protein
MKIPRRLLRLNGWVGPCAAALLAAIFCTSVFAGEGAKNVVIAPLKNEPLRPAPKKQLYMFTSASAIPQPIKRVVAPIATTAIPVTVYKNSR